MSNEAVTRFLARLAEDSALQQEARLLAKDAQDPAAAAVDLGAKQGFQFTAAEFLEVVQSARTGGKELSDADLDPVAGGLQKISYSLSDAGALFFVGSYSFKHIGNTKYDDAKLASR